MAAKRQSLFAYFTLVSKQKRSSETDSSQGKLMILKGKPSVIVSLKC